MAKKKAPVLKIAQIDRLVTDIHHLRIAKQALEVRMDRLEQETRAKFAALTQVADLFTTLRRVLNMASAELAGAASYTQKEIADMSADDYREKVLVPLNMGRRV